MKRFIDLRGQDTGFRFAWYDTRTYEFERFNGNQAWDDMTEFKFDYAVDRKSDKAQLDRYRGLALPWAFESSPDDE